MNASRRAIDSGLLAKAGRSVQSGAFDKKRGAPLKALCCAIGSEVLAKPDVLRSLVLSTKSVARP